MKKYILLLFFLIISWFLFLPQSYAKVFLCIDNSECSAGENCVGGNCVTQGSIQGSVADVFGKIQPPAAVSNIGIGTVGINNVLNKAVELIYITASIIFVFMILISALQWILSAGDKEKVSQAKGRLTHALIGITILALAWVIIGVVGQITGFTFFQGQGP